MVPLAAWAHMTGLLGPLSSVALSTTGGVPLDPVLLVTGLVLATTGVFIYRVAILGFGVVFGGAAGMLLGTTLSASLPVFAAAVLIGAVVGVMLIKTAFKTVVVGAGALTGAAGGLWAAGASLSNPASLVNPLLAVGVVLGIVAAWFLRKLIVLVLSAAWGASLVSITRTDFGEASTISEIIDAFVSPELVWVFVLGIGVQVGLWVGIQYYRGEADEGGFLGGLLRDDTTSN